MAHFFKKVRDNFLPQEMLEFRFGAFASDRCSVHHFFTSRQFLSSTDGPSAVQKSISPIFCTIITAKNEWVMALSFPCPSRERRVTPFWRNEGGQRRKFPWPKHWTQSEEWQTSGVCNIKPLWCDPLDGKPLQVRPLGHKSSPITTRPGLPHKIITSYWQKIWETCRVWIRRNNYP